MIIFMGVPGAGKSVQGRWLADQLGLPWLSTGEFLRMLVSGKQRKDMLAGKLLTDKEIIALVQKIFTVVNKNKEFVLDGFPRTGAQADWLLSQVKHGQLKATGVIHLKSSKATVRKRLMSRARQDDTESVINKRFDEYKKTILPILKQFKKVGIPVVEVNGDRSLEEVHESVMSALKN